MVATPKTPAPKRKPSDEKKIVARNKRAYHDYFVDEQFEAGLVLHGSEVKSIREGKVTIGEGYVMVRDGEAFLINVQISEYPWANVWNHAPKRERKLLLNRREIDKLDHATARAGYTALPLELYVLRGRVKLLVGVCRGKKQHDKRDDSKRRDADREIQAAMRGGRRGR